MSAFFLIFVLLAMAHFVYEGILAPSNRLELRCKLFQQRDRLRTLRATNPKELDKVTFDLMHDGINTAIKLVPAFQLSILWLAVSMKHDQKVTAEIRRRESLLAKCPLQEVHEIDKAVALTTRNAFLVNAAGSFLWLFPVALILVCLHRLTTLARELLRVPAKEIDRLLPSEQMAM